ncbi:MAG: hypothetical protein KDC46_10980 [Thermoleophilia bacterium]|nr:hypothetical protein [Thermoleophilia bacterium]
MRDRSSTTEDTTYTHPAEAPVQEVPGKRFKRSFRGYRRNLVDDALARMELRIADLEEQSVQLREELLDAQHVAGEARHDLTRAKAELRYWNDRASYVDSEVARARQRALELEQSARERAEAIEADAQERSLQLVDRVCVEANQIMQAARDEAREMFLRFETDVDMSQQKLDKLEQVRREVAQTMQSALLQFENAVQELDKVAPAKRIVSQLEEPTRRAVPTFGRRKAQEAARRFDQGVEHDASAALSSPLPTVLSASVDGQAPEPTPTMIDPSGTNTGATTTSAGATVPAAPAAASPAPADAATTGSAPRKVHDADEEFAALLMQP